MSRSRFPIILLLIVGLVFAGFFRGMATAERYSGVGGATRAKSAGGLGGMNSFALGLLLGGLRGPLVMFLWPSSEEQKHQRNLEDFNTKIEWIRLLQAEFDSVHTFQIWNMAYNISAQMSNLGNKYWAILEGLDYGFRVNSERPHNINIISEIARVYYEKLGMSFEMNYYRQRVREETQARPEIVRVELPAQRRAELIDVALDAGYPSARLRFSPEQQNGNVGINLPAHVADAMRERFSGPGVTFTPRPRVTADRSRKSWQRTELDPMLDENGNILPAYLTPTLQRPEGLEEGRLWNDGSELQYLKQYEPFPYGISTLALGYNHYKRAQILQEVYKQRRAQSSERVVDSRPAVSLRGWAEEEWRQGRRAELDAFGRPVPEEPVDMELPTAEIRLNAAIPHRPRLDEAIYSYGRSSQIIDDSIAEYQRHLRNDAGNLGVYLNHMDDLLAQQQLVLADRDFLEALVDPSKREEKRKSAAEHYRRAMARHELVALQYYAPEQVIAQLPQGLTKANLAEKYHAGELTDDQLAQLFFGLLGPVISQLEAHEYGEELREYLTYVTRARLRLANLQA